MATPTFILPSAPTYTEGFVNGLNVYPDPTNFVANQVPFTRATTATRTNAAGLIELVPYNLVTYSEQFDNANWGGVAVSVTADTSISPSGLLNADTINITSSSGYRRQFVSTLNSSNYTFSAYVKKSANTGTNLFRLYYNNNTVPPNNGLFRAVIDLTNLTITTTTTGTITTGQPTIISSNLTSVGNGWYRAEISFTTGTAAASTISEFGFQSNGTTVEFLAWGAQFVEGTNALPYQLTETRLNRPRVDFSLGGCPNLLLEPQRTNLALRSEEFDSSIWSKNFGGIGSVPVVTPNAGISPSGITNADRIQFTLNGGTTNAAVSDIRQSIPITTGSYTLSFWIKSFDETSSYQMLVRDANGIINQILVTGVWKRYTITSTYSSPSATIGFGIRGGQTPINPNTADILVWGAQLELGAYPTTYIPTTSASVTRNSDSFQLSNVFTNNMISSAGGTWFVDLRGNIARTRDSVSLMAISDTNGTIGNNSFRFFTTSTPNTRLVISKYITGVDTSLYTTLTDNLKVAIKWNGSTADIFANGVKVVSATAFTATNLDFLFGFAADVPKNINSMALYNTPLSDDELEVITGEGFDTYALMASNYNYILQ